MSLKKNITAAIDKKTAITNVSVTLQNPKIAAIVADSVVHQFARVYYRLSYFKSEEKIVFIWKNCLKSVNRNIMQLKKNMLKYVDTHDNLILQSVRAEQERLQNDMSLAYQVYSQVDQSVASCQSKSTRRKASVCSGRATCRTIKTFRYRSESLCFAICLFIRF